MHLTEIPDFKYLGISASQVRKEKYICLQLTAQLGRKRFSIGKESKSSLDKAIECAYAIDRYCENQLAKGDSINIDEIAKTVERIKKPRFEVVSVIDIRILWKKYVEFHSSLNCWAKSYSFTHIQTIGSLIDTPSFPQSIERPSEILQWLLDRKKSVKTAKSRFKIIVSAVDWASRNDLIERKYGIKYRDCLSSLNKKTRQKDKQYENEVEWKIDCFDKEEVLKILEAFKNESYARFKGKHKQYYSFLKFLWLTGCRPSEAVALKWSNVLFSSKKIYFCEAEVIASGKVIKKKGTKTQPYRFFPINIELLELLESIPRSDDYVFLKNNGTTINIYTLRGIWKNVLSKLGIRYRVPYQLRHSMISYHANRGFPLTQLAEIVGNSEKVIREHYLKVDITLINVPTID